MPKPKFRAFWSDADEAYIGTCNEYPSLSWISDTKQGALEGIKAVVKDIRADEQPQRAWVPVVFLLFAVVFIVAVLIDVFVVP